MEYDIVSEETKKSMSQSIDIKKVNLINEEGDKTKMQSIQAIIFIDTPD